MVPVRQGCQKRAGTPGVLAPRNGPERVIDAIRESFPEAELVYTNGGCYGLFRILRSIYPQAEAYYDPIIGHVYTEIDGKLYDIRGRARISLDKLDRMRDDSRLMRKVHRWSPTYKFMAG